MEFPQVRIGNTQNGYGMVSRAIHWGSAGLIMLAWFVGSTMEGGARGAQGPLQSLHFSLGFLVLSLVAVRLLWRMLDKPPGPVAGTPAWQHFAAGVAHLVLYALMLVVPLSGLMDRWARGRTVTVLWSIDLPPPFAIPGGRAWGEVHETLANLLLAVVAAHAAAALWHHFVLRDGVLRRMTGGAA
jgi:cytochrome b561